MRMRLWLLCMLGALVCLAAPVSPAMAQDEMTQEAQEAESVPATPITIEAAPAPAPAAEKEAEEAADEMPATDAPSTEEAADNAAEEAPKTTIPEPTPSLWQRAKNWVGGFSPSEVRDNVSDFVFAETRVLETPSVVGEIEIGAKDAPVQMVEYASLTCPHCASFHALTLPEIKEKYVETGRVRILFRHFPFDPQGTAGAMLAQCAPPAQKAGLLDILFVRQRAWALADEPIEALQQIARQIGMTKETTEACWKDEELLAGIRAMQKDAYEVLQVRSTPTFFVNGERFEGALRLNDFEDIFARYVSTKSAENYRKEMQDKETIP